MDSEEKRKKLRRIEIRTRKLSNQVFAGSYHSAFKGRGISFSEVREYQYGDDIRMIDWNVTARNRKPFVKVFEEERELTVMLLIDVSQSSFFGTKTEFKNHIIAEISGVLAFSAITNNDKVGVLFFSDVVEKFIPPKKGKSHIMRIISEIYDFHPKQTGTNIAEALKYFNNVVKKKCIAFLLSDFMDTGFKDALNISARKHDLIGLHIYDERESKLTDAGLVQMRDAESGQEFWVDTSDKKLREAYAKHFEENRKAAREIFGKSGAQLESIHTEDNYVISLMNMFKRRAGKR
ncbi:MAG: DUF58 domain-containing protein [Bacteroidetes bacterium]|nr:DUF58 domain-containing protein [Bacteroidota bacterium]MBK8658020.1 DUF58 domain-containing protein [Bacteroidota bacterium]